MRRENTPRRLHMGCGEGLTGRLPAQDRSGAVPRDASRCGRPAEGRQGRTMMAAPQQPLLRGELRLGEPLRRYNTWRRRAGEAAVSAGRYATISRCFCKP